MSRKLSRNEIRKRKHARIRQKVTGTGERPRLCVFRSLQHIYAQIVDDTTGKTLVSASTLDPAIKAEDVASSNKEGAAAVGKLIATRAIDNGITEVVFDRAGYLYHGRVASLAEAAREVGLKF